MSQQSAVRRLPAAEPETAVDLSLLIPIYNEADNVRPLYEEIVAALEPHAALGRWELVFVDDGSTDASPEVLRALRAADPRVRVIRLAKNAGQSAAFAAGFGRVRGDAVVMLDGDGQNDPADIPKLVGALAGHDAVCGIRAKRRDDVIRRISSKVGNFCRRSVTGDEIVDTGCSLKAFRRELLVRVPMFNGMHRFLGTLGGYAGARIAQIPVNHRERTRGTSKYGVWNRLWVTMADLAAVYWMRRRWLRYQAEEVEP